MKKRLISSILCLALAFVIGGGVFFTAFSFKAEASESTIVHSDVLSDLKRDNNFNEDDYPANLTDHSMQMIALTESNKKEVFVYVYHPSNVDNEIKAEKISLSLQSPDNPDKKFHLYDLAFINSNRVFSKYKIVGLRASEIPERYYSVAGIYRKYDETLGDSNPETVDGTSMKAFSVGHYWCCYYSDNKLVCEKEEMEVLELEIKASGSVTYYDGYKLYHDFCDSFYVAFKAQNFNIEKVINADIRYIIQRKETTSCIVGGFVDTSEPETIETTIYENENSGNSGGGLFGKKRKWDRIQTPASFIEMVNSYTHDDFDEAEAASINEADFVFCFAEADRSIVRTSHIAIQGITSLPVHFDTIEKHTELSEVGILRMTFMVPGGQVYNLGVVSDLVDIDGNPEGVVSPGDNILDYLKEFSKKLGDWLEKLIVILLAILVIVFLGPISKVLMFVWNSITSIIKIVTKPIKNLFYHNRN